MGREGRYKANGGAGGGRNGKDKNTSSSGCMSLIFNVFDINHHRFRFHHPSFMSESTVTDHQHSNLCHQGIEAPRSSLESPESSMEVAPSSSKVKEQTNLNIPVGRIQIKSKRSRLTDDVSSECSNSPGTKTPSLVARLMGLDLLPEYSSPRPSSFSTPATSRHHTRSLPATPRSSTGSRRSTGSTDIDYHHRLSLQINKENYNSQEHDRKIQYAKQITNQVRERISRRLGTDITNTVSPAGKDQRRDSNLVLLRPKKAPVPVKSKQDESTQLSSSPKVRLLDIKSNLYKPVLNPHPSLIKEVKSKCKTPKVRKPPSMTPEKPVKDGKVKRVASERYDLRLKKNKSTAKFISFKKEMTSSPSTTRSSQLQVSLPSRLKSSYKAYDTDHKHKTPATTTTSAVNRGSFSNHFDYISRILNQCGIDTTTPISAGKWYSHSHPLHPSIFHQLAKLHHPTDTATRRMIFDLVDESLVEILKQPYMNHKPLDSCVMYGSDLIGKLCERIGGFPAAHCEVLEDIDGLIEKDMGRSTRWMVATAVEAEGEDIVKEIEREIVESLVHEIATETVAPAMSDRVRSSVLFT